MLLEVINNFCQETKAIWNLVGNILLIVKIVIPILVIIFGMIDIGKSVVNSKPEDISKSFKSFLFRLVAAIAIFFIPTLVSFAIKLANGFNDVENDYKTCATCIESPSKC